MYGWLLQAEVVLFIVTEGFILGFAICVDTTGESCVMQEILKYILFWIHKTIYNVYIK